MLIPLSLKSAISSSLGSHAEYNVYLFVLIWLKCGMKAAIQIFGFYEGI